MGNTGIEPMQIDNRDNLKIVEKIWFEMPGSLGDALLALPAARLFQRCFTLIGYFRRRDMLSLLSACRMTHRGTEWSFAELTSHDKAWKREEPVFHPLGASLRPWGAAHERIVSVPVATIGGVHHAWLNLEAASAWTGESIVPRDLEITLALRGKDVTRCDHLVALLPSCAQYHGEGGQREWDDAAWSELARMMLRAGLRPLYLGQGKAGGKAPRSARDLRGKTSLVHAARALARCRAAVGIDSGLSHLAAMLGIPTLTLFGPTDETRTAPLGKDVLLLKSVAAPCRPCQGTHLWNHCETRACMNFSPGEVYACLEHLLSASAG